MPGGESAPLPRRDSAKQQRQCEAQIMDAFEHLRRSDPCVYAILAKAICAESVRLLHAVGVLVSYVSRPVRRRAQ